VNASSCVNSHDVEVSLGLSRACLGKLSFLSKEIEKEKPKTKKKGAFSHRYK
jgi:hypothetical protein